MTPSPDEVRAALERVLASDVFANAGRLSRLLRYIVERTLAGEGDQLKEYVLGVEVFDRNDSYDPRLDSIVRVEARRLRSKLAEYYRTQGATDLLTIAIPRGSYIPVFSLGHRSEATSGGVVEDHHSDAASRRSWRWVAVGSAAVVVLLIVAFTLRSSPAPTTAAQASSGPSIAVLPFEHFSTSPADAVVAARITDGVTTELARLGTVSVASRTSASKFSGKAGTLRDIARTLDVAFVMEGSTLVRPEGIHVEARIVDGVSDRKVWVGQYDGRPDELVDLTRRIATEAATGVLKRSSR